MLPLLEMWQLWFRPTLTLSYCEGSIAIIPVLMSDPWLPGKGQPGEQSVIMAASGSPGSSLATGNNRCRCRCRCRCRYPTCQQTPPTPPPVALAVTAANGEMTGSEGGWGGEAKNKQTQVYNFCQH